MSENITVHFKDKKTVATYEDVFESAWVLDNKFLRIKEDENTTELISASLIAKVLITETQTEIHDNILVAVFPDD